MNQLNELYYELNRIGIRVTFDFHPTSHIEPDIERILVKACYYMDEDGRLLNLIFSWLKVHGSHLVADKFLKEYENSKRYLGETPWFSALCAYMGSLKDHRFKKGITRLKKPHHFLNTNQDSLVKLKGAVKFLEEIGIIMAQSSLRIRESDVLSIEELIACNRQYRNRYAFGANWRSEIITAIQNGATTPAQISKLLGIARSRVGIVFKEYLQVKQYI